MRMFTYIKVTARNILCALMLCSGSSMAFAQDVDYKAYTLFVYNFMKYTEWPEAQSKGAFVVGVLGNSPIQKELEALAATKKIKGRTITIKKISTVEEARDFQMVYVASGKSSMLKALKDATKDKPVFIVGEREGTAKKGAGVSFVTLDDDGLKFDINNKEIASHRLVVSDQLVRLGLVVDQ